MAPRADLSQGSLQRRYLIMELLQELNLVHQRLNLPLQLQAGQSGIVHILGGAQEDMLGGFWVLFLKIRLFNGRDSWNII